MCGVAGVVSRYHAVQPVRVGRMLQEMVNRGPDGHGTWATDDGHVLLGHRRLAIVDLSERGRQPLVQLNGKRVITFNGEIYNFRRLRSELIQLGYQFHSQTDTEVILNGYEHWGTDVVSRLDGMFAFAIYDPKSKDVFCARDRAGEKPFFYAFSQAEFSFASGLSSLLSGGHTRKINRESLQWFLAYGYSPPNESLVEGVNKLAAGHAMLLNLDQWTLKAWRYWNVPEPSATPLKFAESVDRLEALLRVSVKDRLEADVDVGVLLSGGIDSSLVTAYAQIESGRRVKTFSVTFSESKKFDESPHARSVSQHFGTEHVALNVGNISPYILDEVLLSIDEPIADHAIIPGYLLAKAVSKEIKVVLGGDGSDELFGGYPHYQWMTKLQDLRRRLPSFLLRLVARSASAILPIGTRGKTHLIGLGTSEGLASVNSYFDVHWRSRLLQSYSFAPEIYKGNLLKSAHGEHRAMLQLDFHSTLQNLYLVKTDRTCMAHSLELRCPFLSTDIVEFAYRCVADDNYFNATELKRIPKALGRRVLPKDYDFQRKQGFTLPLADWYRKEWGPRFREILTDKDSTFCRKAVDAIFRAQTRGYPNMHRLFLLTAFEIWRKNNSIAT